MKKIKLISSKIGFAILIMVVIFIMLKNMVLRIWTPEESTITYAINGIDGREMKMIFMEDQKLIFWFYDQNSGFTEVVLTEIKGIYGTHYFGQIWSIEGKFGFRIYPKGVEPVKTEVKILKKYLNEEKESSFAAEGETTTPVMQFRNNGVKFQDMWLIKEPNDQEFIQDLLLKLSQ